MSAIKLLTMNEAADMLHSSVTASSLHQARRDGTLWAKKIGKMYYTNMPAIKEFLECPDPESLPASIFEKTNNNGSSATAARNSGQALVSASVKRLKTNSLSILQTENRQTAEVQPIRGN